MKLLIQDSARVVPLRLEHGLQPHQAMGPAQYRGEGKDAILLVPEGYDFGTLSELELQPLFVVEDVAAGAARSYARRTKRGKYMVSTKEMPLADRVLPALLGRVK